MITREKTTRKKDEGLISKKEKQLSAAEDYIINLSGSIYRSFGIYRLYLKTIIFFTAGELSLI